MASFILYTSSKSGRSLCPILYNAKRKPYKASSLFEIMLFNSSYGNGNCAICVNNPTLHQHNLVLRRVLFS